VAVTFVGVEGVSMEAGETARTAVGVVIANAPLEAAMPPAVFDVTGTGGEAIVVDDG